jgi:hypothetical protein
LGLFDQAMGTWLLPIEKKNFQKFLKMIILKQKKISFKNNYLFVKRYLFKYLELEVL